MALFPPIRARDHTHGGTVGDVPPLDSAGWPEVDFRDGAKIKIIAHQDHLAKKSSMVRLKASVQRALQRIEHARHVDLEHRKATTEEPSDCTRSSSRQQICSGACSCHLDTGQNSERIEVARQTMDHCIAVFSSLSGMLSIIKSGYERAFEQLGRQLATVNEYLNHLSTMDDIHARAIRGQEACNKKMVAKLNQMTMMSVNSNDTVQAQLEVVLARRQVKAKKRAELSNDLKIVMRALESSEEAYKFRVVGFDKTGMDAKLAAIETQRVLRLEEIKAVRDHFRETKKNQANYLQSILAEKREKEELIEDLDARERILEPREANLTEQIADLMQKRSIRRMVVVMRSHNTTQCRLVLWRWGDNLKADRIAEQGRIASIARLVRKSVRVNQVVSAFKELEADSGNGSLDS